MLAVPLTGSVGGVECRCEQRHHSVGDLVDRSIGRTPCEAWNSTGGKVGDRREGDKESEGN